MLIKCLKADRNISSSETTSATPPLGKTEYQDGVSKLGAIIMRDKLHRKQ